MSDVEISRTESLTRHQAAQRLAALAAALGDGGHVEVELGASRVKLHVPDHVRCEVEVEVDGDEVELEVELKWSTAASAPASATAEQAEKSRPVHETPAGEDAGREDAAEAKPSRARGAKARGRARA